MIFIYLLVNKILTFRCFWLHQHVVYLQGGVRPRPREPHHMVFPIRHLGKQLGHWVVVIPHVVHNKDITLQL